MSRQQSLFIGLALSVLAGPALAQFDPPNREWGKADPNHIRVMTWNVQDNIRLNESKQDTLNAWSAIARIVADLEPDVLLLQETGDDNCFGCVDTIAQLETTLDNFFDGGFDTANNVPVQSYVTLYNPDADMNHYFVSGANDSFNRNIIVSKFPFVDLNGDNRSQYSDIEQVLGDASEPWVPGGSGGIRGFQFAEIDLPDDIYAGDLVIGNAHLKAGGSSSDRNDRRRAAQNVAYFMYYFFNGAMTGQSNPNNGIFAFPPPPLVLDENTPIIIGGDWNEDESRNAPSDKGPAAWLTEADIVGGSVGGTDADGTDMIYDAALVPGSSDGTTQSSSKLDYIGWQDSVATAVNEFIFNSGRVPGSWLPPATAGYFFDPSGASSFASDHRPVIVDFVLPPAGPMFELGDMNCDGLINTGDIDPFVMALLDPLNYPAAFPDCDIFNADINQSGEINTGDIDPFVALLIGP